MRVGLHDLPVPVSSQILNKAFTLNAQRIEAKYKNSLIGTHYKRVTNLIDNPLTRLFSQRIFEADILSLTCDSNYENENQTVFEPASLSIKSFYIKNNKKQFFKRFLINFDLKS